MVLRVQSDTSMYYASVSTPTFMNPTFALCQHPCHSRLFRTGNMLSSTLTEFPEILGRMFV